MREVHVHAVTQCCSPGIPAWVAVVLAVAAAATSTASFPPVGITVVASCDGTIDVELVPGCVGGIPTALKD